MSEKVRVLRIIEYVGTREWVENTLQKGMISAEGSKSFGKDNENTIKSCLVDKFPEIFKEDKSEGRSKNYD